MGDKTGISWTDSTWNPLRGCSRVSEGCRNCYAERVAGRFSGPGLPYEGLVTIGEKGPRWNGVVRLVPERLADPIRWKKPRRIFVNSMSDLFHENVSNEDIAAIFGVMANAPQHTFQVLTKRPERMRAWFEWVTGMVGRNITTNAQVRVPVDALVSCVIQATRRGVKFGPMTLGTPEGDARIRQTFPLRNVDIGVSVEDRNTAAQRIPLLLETPAARRFVSFEPALEEVDFTHIDAEGRGGSKSMYQIDALTGRHSDMGRPCADVARLDWIIVGGESGAGARRFDIEWARSTIRQCKGTRVACFVKQLGSCAYGERDGIAGASLKVASDVERYVTNRLQDRAGSDMAEWPEDLRVQQFPGDIV